MMLLPSSPPNAPNRKCLAVWLGSSLLVTFYYGLVSLIYAFSSPYLVQDDVRHYVVWMQRLVDPELFPNDWIAEYFQTVTPIGFKLVFVGFSALEIEPLIVAKILPLLLGLIATVYAFYTFMLLLPSPSGAFLSTLILNQQLWLNDDLISATPRAFVYPIFLAFLYYLLRRSMLPCLVTSGYRGYFFLNWCWFRLAC